MKVRQAIMAGALAAGLILGPAVAATAQPYTPNMVIRPMTSPYGSAPLPFGWGYMHFQIFGRGNLVSLFSGNVFNDTPDIPFAARAAIYYRGQPVRRWTGWVVVEPCATWFFHWGSPWTLQWEPTGLYSLVIQITYGAYVGEQHITWEVF